MATRAAERDRLREERLAHEQAEQVAERRRKRLGQSGLVVLVLALAVALIAFTRGGEDGGSAPAGEQAEATAGHVHGLGIDPGSGSLYIATHNGLFQAAPGQAAARRVGSSGQDVMGFTVAGRRLLGSGHPGPGQNLPPLLGLIESADGGRSWEPVSLLGEADFHVLRAAGDRVYGFDGTQERLMVSADGGRRWVERTPPGPLLDLSIDPADAERAVASTPEALFVSEDAGEAWRPLQLRRAVVAGLLAWPARERLFLLTVDGRVQVSRNGGRRFEEAGRVDGAPVAFMADGNELYVALGDGTVRQSSDGGASWAMRATV